MGKSLKRISKRKRFQRKTKKNISKSRKYIKKSYRNKKRQVKKNGGE